MTTLGMMNGNKVVFPDFTRGATSADFFADASEASVTYNADDYAKTIRLPEIHIDPGEEVTVTIKRSRKQQWSPTTHIVPTDSRNSVQMSATMSHELSEQNEALQAMIRTLQFKVEELEEKLQQDTEDGAMLERLVKQRTDFERFGILMGIMLTLFLVIISTVRIVPWQSIVPAGVMFLSLTMFVMLRRSLRGGTDDDN